MSRRFRPRSKQTPTKPPTGEEIAAFVRGVKTAKLPDGGYREASLRLHGWVCAKCAREFTLDNLHLLTVHHKDSNHHNNPPDGSNWENLCAYCHEDEHGRELLGEYLDGEVGTLPEPSSGGGLGTLGDLLRSKKPAGKP